MEKCLFCKIAQKEIPANIKYENEKVIAFSDINPKAPIHILIIPKRHIASINELTKRDESLVSELVFVAKNLARENKIDKTGYRIVSNTGLNAGQEVKHLHFHLLGGKKLADIG